MSLEAAIASLPAPFSGEKFARLQRGIHDSPETEVYLNQEGDFAFLYPRPEVDYVAYRPRVQKLGLASYKRTLDVVGRRYRKVAPLLASARSLLEVGAGDGSFLACAGRMHGSLSLACVEVDTNTREARDRVPGLRQYDSLEDAAAAEIRHGVVCFFHVLEHILEPAPFLARCRACLAPGGALAIEVPSLDDPLLSLYESAAYRSFYFQRQHPYSYSARSLARLLEHEGLVVEQAIAHQRYGIENHLQWLSRGEPGGNDRFRELFSELDDGYRRRLEESGRSDAVIAVARERA